MRERKEEIPGLVGTFIARFAKQLGKPEPQMTPEAFQRLMDYDWPGNIRELQNAIEYGVVLAHVGRIGLQQLPKELLVPPMLRSSAPISTGAPVLNLDARERDAILSALVKSCGNKRKAAELLGIHRPTLYSKMKRYGIEL